MVFAASSAPATAMGPAQSESINVSAEVLPTKTIFIDTAGRIVKIISNSETDGQLKVFLSDDLKHETMLSAEIKKQYSYLAEYYDLNKVGVVYPLNIKVSNLTSEVSPETLVVQTNEIKASNNHITGEVEQRALTVQVIKTENTYLTQSAASIFITTSSSFNLQGS